MGKKRHAKPVRSKVEATKAPTMLAGAEASERVKEAAAAARSATGTLMTHKEARDVQLSDVNLTFHGHTLVVDSKLEFIQGRRYGLLGANGSGKTTLMAAIAAREVPIPEHIDIFYLDAEVEPSEKTPLEIVMEHQQSEVKRLEGMAERMVAAGGMEDPEQALLVNECYERLDELDPDRAEARVAEILHGLGFTPAMMNLACSSLSGGWRMRVSLAFALFVKPTLMVLDEPTNHLDTEACVWLEEYLKKAYAKRGCLYMVSHSEDFLNSVCTNIIHLHQQRLEYYTGDYDDYVRTRQELEANQEKRFKWEQDQIAHMKQYIARFGHGNKKMARQAQSKEKVLAKMEREGLTQSVRAEKTVSMVFPDPGAKLPPPVLQFIEVGFTYPDGKKIYDSIDLGFDCDSRVAIVGPNGAGKSTLIKLMSGELTESSGTVRRHSKLRFAKFTQHLAETLDLEKCAIDYFRSKYCDDDHDVPYWRGVLGRMGVTGKAQSAPMLQLSDGERSRICFAEIAYKVPNMLLLDEPTNHLDMESIDALAAGIRSFGGGVVLVTHDFRLIQKAVDLILVCENGQVTKWEGDIMEYKMEMKRSMGLL